MLSPNSLDMPVGACTSSPYTAVFRMLSPNMPISVPSSCDSSADTPPITLNGMALHSCYVKFDCQIGQSLLVGFQDSMTAFLKQPSADSGEGEGEAAGGGCVEEAVVMCFR